MTSAPPETATRDDEAEVWRLRIGLAESRAESADHMLWLSTITLLAIGYIFMPDGGEFAVWIGVALVALWFVAWQHRMERRGAVQEMVLAMRERGFHAIRVGSEWYVSRADRR